MHQNHHFLKRSRIAAVLAGLALAAAGLTGCGWAPVREGTPNVTMDGTGVGNGEGSMPAPRTIPKAVVP